MARRRKPKDSPSADLPMTPMIDVVFQLLIFFIVTLKPIDVMAHLDVTRPSPERQQKKMDVPKNLLRIGIFYDGFTINDRPVNEATLDEILGQLADLDRNQTVLIQTSAASRHEFLIKVLNLCARNQMMNLSVISVN